MSQLARQYQQKMTNIAVLPAYRLQEETETLTDERAKLDYEQSRLYIQNQILDNCLSTIKHESMYYPSRIKLLAEKMGDGDIDQFAELVQYYHRIYTLLCSQADEQVGQPAFRRKPTTVGETMARLADMLPRLCRRAKVNAEWTLGTSSAEDMVSLSSETPSPPDTTTFLADETLLDVLFESLLTGMLHEGAKLILRAEDDSRFVRFTITDTSRSLTEEELDNLFFPQDNNIPYLVAKQILREHDTYANHPGCRLVPQKSAEGGYEIFFTLVKRVRD